MEIGGTVVIITGASSGIGLASARAFVAQGAKVALVGRSAESLGTIAAELRDHGYEAVAAPADVREHDQVGRMVEAVLGHFGRIDVLVNNAGLGMMGPVAEADPAHVRQVLEVNILGPLHAIQAVLPPMRRQGGGLIINVSSGISKIPPARWTVPGSGVYAATKSALNMLSDTLRIELAPDNIRVVSIYPRVTRTAFFENALGHRFVQAGAPLPAADSPELVAQKILEATRDEPAEQFMAAPTVQSSGG